MRLQLISVSEGKVLFGIILLKCGRMLWRDAFKRVILEFAAMFQRPHHTFFGTKDGVPGDGSPSLRTIKANRFYVVPKKFFSYFYSSPLPYGQPSDVYVRSC